jgi:hypothetical protein
MRDERGIVRGIAFLLLCVVGFPSGLSAQVFQGIPRSPIATSGDRVPEDFYIMPWVAAGVLYDDNVLFSQRGQRQDDVFYRITPGIQGSYRSTPFTVIADYRFDSEIYSKLHQLDSATQRQFGTVELRGRPTSNWNVGGTVGYAQTKTPYELNFLTSAQVARLRTERYFVNPTTEYRIDPVTRLTGQYIYSHDDFAGQQIIDSNIINLGVDRRVSSHDTLGPAYLGRYFTFGGTFGGIGNVGTAEPFQSHALMLAWGHDFSTDTRLDIRVGPRVSNGKLDNTPEAYVGIRRRIQGGDLSLGYTSGVTTIIGTGTTRVDSIVAMMSYEPVKHLTLTAGPTAAWISNSGFTSSIYTAYFEAAYQFNKYVTAKGSAFFSYQEGNFLPIGGATANNIIVSRDVFWLRLEFTYASRWD